MTRDDLERVLQLLPSGNAVTKGRIRTALYNEDGRPIATRLVDVTYAAPHRVRVTLEFYTPEKEPG